LPKSYATAKRWNPKYLSGCVRHALDLLPKKGAAIDLSLEAAKHLECTETYDCRRYRQQLKQGIGWLRRKRRIEPWEYWLLLAAEAILHPIPGCKHRAVTLLHQAIDEYDSTLHEAWWNWHDQYAVEEPAYL
jgi:hypothetical protein